MNNKTTMTLSFGSLAFALALATCGCDRNPSQADNMSSHSMAATNQSQMSSTESNTMNDMTHAQMAHMKSNSMNMAGSSTNNMDMSHSPQTSNMMSGAMITTNQSK
jgi:hypothetical protein